MSDKHSHNRSRFLKVPPKYSKAIYVLLACWLLLQAGSTWSQQIQREYVYLDGKLVSAETNSITPLAVNVTSPTSSPTYITSSGTVTLSGSLSGHSGAAQVIWTSDRGSSGSCSGTASWTCGSIPLLGGANGLVITARDSVFSSGADILTVTKSEYAISPTSVYIGGQGGGGNVSVTTSSGCSWTASSNNAWITVTGGSSGSGSGMVSYSVAANGGAARDGSITIAGQTFTVSQGACPYCGDGICTESCATCPQDCCPGCDTQCMATCLWYGYPLEYCALQCGCY